MKLWTIPYDSTATHSNQRWEKEERNELQAKLQVRTKKARVQIKHAGVILIPGERKAVCVCVTCFWLRDREANNYQNEA